jgi:hypothetical protein
MTEPIKLPPLPGGVAVMHVYDADEMQSYARLAVEPSPVLRLRLGGRCYDQNRTQSRCQDAAGVGGVV